MNTRHLVDPQMVELVDALPESFLSLENLEEVRANATRIFPEAAPRDDLTIQERHISGPADAPDIRLVVTASATPAEAPAPALLWLHSGGYVMGAPEQSQWAINGLIDELGCVVVSVDYRLSPETPHPGPLDDCYAALQWLHENAEELGVDPGRIAVIGDSAGGGLAAALAQVARDRAEIPLCAQILLYPMLDDRTVVEVDPNPHTGQYIWSRKDNAFGWTSLLGHEPGAEQVADYASPARIPDVGGLPPAFIAVGSIDLFADECIRYAHRLLRSGVPTELHVHPGAVHGYLFLPVDAGTRLRREVAEALRAAFAKQAKESVAPNLVSADAPGA